MAEALLEGLLRGLPLWPQSAQLRLSFCAQRPPALPTISANAVAREPGFLDQRQSPGGGRLIDANYLSQFARRQIRCQLECLQRRVLRRVKAAVAKHVLVKHRYRPSNLAQSRAITG